MGLPASRTVIKLPQHKSMSPSWCCDVHRKHLEWLKIAMRWGGGSILILQPPVKIRNYSNNWFNIYKQKQLQKNSSLSAAWKPHNTKVSYHFSKKRDWGLLSYQWHLFGSYSAKIYSVPPPPLLREEIGTDSCRQASVGSSQFLATKLHPREALKRTHP